MYLGANRLHRELRSRRGGWIPRVDELNIPIRFIGVGEQVDDLRTFNASEFILEKVQKSSPSKYFQTLKNKYS